MLISFSGVERVSEEPDVLRLFCCTGGRPVLSLPLESSKPAYACRPTAPISFPPGSSKSCAP